MVRCEGVKGLTPLMGSWGNALSRSPQRAKFFCSMGFLRRSLKLGLGQRPIAASPQKHCKPYELPVCTQTYQNKKSDKGGYWVRTTFVGRNEI